MNIFSARWTGGRVAPISMVFPHHTEGAPARSRGCQVPGHGLQFVSRHSLQFSDAGMKIYLAGEAEAGSAGEQPAKE